MPREPRMRPDGASTQAARRRRGRQAVAAIGGSLFGLVTSLYSEELRRLLEASVSGLAGHAVPILLTAVVASVSSVICYEFLFRRQRPHRVIAGRIRIDQAALDPRFRSETPVAGRQLHYLESPQTTADLVVLLHGLGLDAGDFRPVMAECRLHSVAFTQYGFNREERDHPDYRPISLAAHVHLLGYALRVLHRRYPRKRISLVGFSSGADLLLMLAEREPETFSLLRPRWALLLDPNVNHTTTTFSSAIAGTSGDREVRELVSILRGARNQSEFVYLAEYVSKIASKDFAHVRGLAKEIVQRYRTEDYRPFLASLARLNNLVSTTTVVLSRDHEKVYSTLAGRVPQRLGVRLECSLTSHFDLIRPNFLIRRLESFQ